MYYRFKKILIQHISGGTRYSNRNWWKIFKRGFSLNFEMVCLRFEFQLHPEGREVSGTKVSTLVFSPSAVSVFDKPVITLYWNIEKNFKIIKNQLIVNLIVHKHIRGYARYQIDNWMHFFNINLHQQKTSETILLAFIQPITHLIQDM